MKIIKKGNLESDVKKITCWKCNSELEYGPNDVETDRDGEYITCPVCNRLIAIN